MSSGSISLRTCFYFFMENYPDQSTNPLILIKTLIVRLVNAVVGEVRVTELVNNYQVMFTVH